jgi:branched-subunit amino acid ABC-type transport system permease component
MTDIKDFVLKQGASLTRLDSNSFTVGLKLTGISAVLIMVMLEVSPRSGVCTP